MISQLEAEAGVARVELELERVQAIRTQLPLLQHRRTDVNGVVEHGE